MIREICNKRVISDERTLEISEDDLEEMLRRSILQQPEYRGYQVDNIDFECRQGCLTGVRVDLVRRDAVTDGQSRNIQLINFQVKV